MADLTLSNIAALYEQYKDSTKYALLWLTAYDGRTTAFCSTREIATAANAIATQKERVPGSVISRLDGAIRVRRRVLELYQGLAEKDEEYEGHAAFIERLEEIRSILSPFVDRTRAEHEDAKQNHVQNKFASLHVTEPRPVTVEDITEEDDIDDAVPDSPPMPEDQGTPSLDRALKDDDLGEWIEMSLLLQETDGILETVKSYWADVALKKIPIALAASLSTVAMAFIGRRWLHGPFQGNAELVVAKWLKHRETKPELQFPEMTQSERQEGRLAHKGGLLRIWQFLRDFKVLGDIMALRQTIEHEKPTDFFRGSEIPCPTEDAKLVKADPDTLALDKMLESMRQLIHGGARSIAALEKSGDEEWNICEPLLPLIKSIHGKRDSTVPMELVFGMELLITSYRGFMWPSADQDQPSMRSCPLEALQFARKVQKEITDTANMMARMFASCKYPLLMIRSALLFKDAAEIAEFVAEKRFDLYYQNPWTAGCHMFKILQKTISIGLDLCDFTGYLCSVLHLYHAMRSLESYGITFKRLPMRDKLCVMFKQGIFLGIIPTENFRSHYRAAIEKSMSHNRQGRRKEGSSSHEWKRLEPKDLGIAMHLAENGYDTDDLTFWQKIYPTVPSTSGTTKIKPGSREAKKLQKHATSRPLTTLLNDIKDAAIPDFSHKPQLNLFAIFRTCAKLLNDLRDSAELDDGMLLKGVAMGPKGGMRVVEIILEVIVEDTRGERWVRENMQYLSWLGTVERAFAKVDVGS